MKCELCNIKYPDSAKEMFVYLTVHNIIICICKTCYYKCKVLK